MYYKKIDKELPQKESNPPSNTLAITPFVYQKKDKARYAFRQMLDELGVSWKATWEQALKLIINDPRYNNTIKAVNERKSVFIQWSKFKEQQERKLNRQLQKQAKEDFASRLQHSTNIKRMKCFTEVEAVLCNESWWSALDSRGEREEIFRNFLKNCDREKKVERHRRRQQKIINLKKHLTSCSWISINTYWHEVSTRLRGISSFEACLKSDRLETFKEVLKLLETTAKTSLGIQRLNMTRIERLNRDGFKSLLRRHAQEGLITAKMRWREYYPLIEGDDIYRKMSSNLNGSRPKQLFNIVIEELEDILLCDTKIITLAINRSDGTLDLRDTLEDFRNHLFNYLESKNIKEIRKKNALYCSGKTKLGLSQITRTNFG
jgi:pre-mRNA-processing factor 40